MAATAASVKLPMAMWSGCPYPPSGPQVTTAAGRTVVIACQLLRDLGAVTFVHSAVGVVPDLDPGERESARGRLHLRSADLAEVLAPRAWRLASPALLATSGADQVDHHVVAHVPDDEAAGAHRFVVRVGQYGQQPTHSRRER